jgi:hypothetical protein
MLFAAASMRRSTIPCRKSELRLLCRYFLRSRRRRSTAQERREAAETFSLLSSDNPLKTLDSKERKKGKGTKRKEKKAKPLFKESV